MSATVTEGPQAGAEKTTLGALPNYASPRWLIYYYVVQFVCQVAPLISSLAGARALMRTFG